MNCIGGKTKNTLLTIAAAAAFSTFVATVKIQNPMESCVPDSKLESSIKSEHIRKVGDYVKVSYEASNLEIKFYTNQSNLYLVECHITRAMPKKPDDVIIKKNDPSFAQWNSLYERLIKNS